MLLKSSPPYPVKRLAGLPAALLGALLASGCATSTFTKADKAFEQVEQSTRDSTEKNAANVKTGAVVRHSLPKLVGREINIKHVGHVPAAFDQDFSYLSSGLALEEICDDLSKKTGFAFRVLGDSTASANSLANPAASSNKAAHVFQWSGKLSGLLDELGRKNSLFWKYTDAGVVFFKTETKNLPLYLPVGKRTVSSSIALAGESSGAGSDSSGSGSSGTVSVSSTMEVDAYTEIAKTVSALIAEQAPESATASVSSNVVVNPTLGMVTVTASPIAMARVEEYLRDLNKNYARNVMIQIKVLSWSLDEEDSFGGSAATLLEDIAGTYALRLTPSGLIGPSFGSPDTASLSLGTKGGAFKMDTIIQAMNQHGRVSLVTSGQVVAVNGQPAPLQVADDITFLESSTTTVSPNVGATTTLTPGTRTVGFTANFLPMFLGDNRILLQYQINLSSLRSLNTIMSNNSSIQTPNISKQSLQQQAYLRDGEGLVLFGFEQNRGSKDENTGVLSLSKKAGSTRNVTVIMIQVNGGRV
jgi:type IVB pilus formation R64 PilN family outer membrane protein